MKRVVCSLLLAALATAPALAIPGQNPPQVDAWGKSTTAFTLFKRSPIQHPDPDGAAYEYLGTLNVDGEDIEFHGKPDSNGVIKLESFVFRDLTGSMANSLDVNLFRDAIASAYGASYASDFMSAQRLPNTGRLALWRGKLLGYAEIAGILMVFTLSGFDALASETVQQCKISGCSPVRQRPRIKNTSQAAV